MVRSAIRTVKRTYTLSEETSQLFEQIVPPGQRSQTVEQLIASRVHELRLEGLRAEIARGLEDMADVSRETNRDWEGTILDGWPAT